jgi:acetoacetyl-[acyl-carrier protein] synthase
LEFAEGDFDFAVLNAKGFGGNNGTALVASPNKTMDLLQSKYLSKDLKKYKERNTKTQEYLKIQKDLVLAGEAQSRYVFGEGVINGSNEFQFESDQIINKVTGEKFSLDSNLPYKEFL